MDAEDLAAPRVLPSAEFVPVPGEFPVAATLLGRETFDRPEISTEATEDDDGFVVPDLVEDLGEFRDLRAVDLAIDGRARLGRDGNIPRGDLLEPEETDERVRRDDRPAVPDLDREFRLHALVDLATLRT